MQKNNLPTDKIVNRHTKIYDVLILGGGASGMMAGAIASDRLLSVLLIDKNKNLGEKLKITGGGRCNITNNEPDIHKFLKVYGEGAPFLYSPFSVFGVKETFQYFESRGLPLVVQARNRVFPKSERAIDVYNLLARELSKNKVEIKTNCLIKKINVRDNKIISVSTNQGDFLARSYVLATGGMSHPETGSTGDGFIFLKDLGHNVITPTPDVVPVAVEEDWVKNLAGVSLSFMKINFYQDGKKQFSKLGKILFTHFGLSGPLILNSAKKIKALLDKGEVKAFIDLYPDTPINDVENKIIKVFDLNKNKMLKSVIKEIVPEGMAGAYGEQFEISLLETKVHSVKKEDRKKMALLLKAMPLTITGLMGYDRSVVADGGVILSEIDMKTMRSKLIENLYITGDLLNLNRDSGGYSLQICWTTGYLAGQAV